MIHFHRTIQAIILTVLCMFNGKINSFSQDSIKSRVIFIGDAGEIDGQQQSVLSGAARMIIPGKTTVTYLGDNIYPSGFGLTEKSAASSKQILRKQFEPMRARGAAVYFIPGNHDWDKMGRKGLEKVQKQWAFVEQQHDSLLKLVPPNGCPDPVEIKISDRVVMIAYDSEWWLFPFNKTDPNADCDCSTIDDVVEKMDGLFYKNRYKIILLAGHHPFQSYGHHSGYYSVMDHIFPFTNAHPNLFIPLPVIGSLYPLLRQIFNSPEDLRHPLYRGMIRRVDEVFEGFPNLVHIAGHEHGLQFIRDRQIQVVSGSGSKNAYVRKGKFSQFADKRGGFVTIDQLSADRVRISYYLAGDSLLSPAFSYLQPYTDFRQKEKQLLSAAVTGDSVLVAVNTGYDSVSRLHRRLFGENYRKEWSTPNTIPVLRISKLKGGLTPLQRGGGNQSKSLRLADSEGREWVLRSVNKYPEVILPEAVRETFAKDVINDAMSGQHPYSALVVPVIANAVRVPHSNPVIGLVAPDSRLGIFQNDFANTVCLFEEREPLGESDNSRKMYKELIEDNDNSFDSSLFLRARLLDLFLGDWDRHEDQWRWADVQKGKGKRYKTVPRDRDQVFHLSEGVFPKIASLPWIAPFLHNFSGRIRKTNAFFTVSNQLNKRFLNQFTYEEWMKTTREFAAAMTDSVLETALQQLPGQSYQLRHDVLLKKWKERRDGLPKAMEGYYRFVNKVVDLQTSDKNEFVSITDAPDQGLSVEIFKKTKTGKVSNKFYQHVFYPKVTRELRLYVHQGDDSVVVNTSSDIRLRIIGKKGKKKYNIVNSGKRVMLYDKMEDVFLSGDRSKVRLHQKNDSLLTAYVPANPYNKVIPSLVVGFNADDGFLAGAGVKFINQGFRKLPYASMQQFSFAHSFSTNAYRFRFQSEWLNLAGNADLVINAKIFAPENTQNFFGLGNNTPIDKSGNYRRYYRTRFSIYQLDPSLRWHTGKTGLFSAGPSLQYYVFDKDDNLGRFINNVSMLHSYDSANVEENKFYAGLVMNYTFDNRNNKLLPQSGFFLNLKIQGYAPMVGGTGSFLQVIPELAFYQELGRQSNLVIANRVGGGLTIGKPAFYQSLFLGGHENLLGYRQYRFAGQSMIYNNAEARIRLAQLGGYIVPGQFGIIAFYDAGKVWKKNYNSGIIHQSLGGGLYFAPAQMAVFQLVAGYSQEGWYPYFTMGFRF